MPLQYVWVIDQVWGQDGWKLAKFFFCVFMDWDEVEVHKLVKKERGQYPTILTEQTWSIKDLLYGFPGNFSFGIERVFPSGPITARDLFILPARGASHITTCRIKIHQSQPLVWPSDPLYVMLAGCDWWISIRHVDNTYDWRKFWKRFLECFVFQSRVSTKTVVKKWENVSL